MLLSRHLCLCLVMMEGLTAFVLPSKSVSPANIIPIQSSRSKLNLKTNPQAQRSLPLCMQQKDCASVINSIKSWADAPNFVKQSKVCCVSAGSSAAGNFRKNMIVIMGINRLFISLGNIFHRNAGWFCSREADINR